MIENIIEQIKTSENKSREIIQDARNQHSGIIEKAYSESTVVEEQARADVLKIFKDAQTKAVSDSRTEIEKLAKQYKKISTEVMGRASLKEKEAIDLIIGKVLK